MLLTIVAIALLTVACAEPLEFADWTIPVPEGTRVVEYPDATAGERERNRVELVEDLVIAPRGDDADYAFYQPRAVEVDAEGRIYVVDAGNHRIQAFDSDGESVGTFGAAGSGPGEFQDRGGFGQLEAVIAGDTLVAYDGIQNKLVRWTLGGEHLGDTALGTARFVDLLAGVTDGTFVARRWSREESQAGEPLTLDAVGRFTLQGEPIATYVELPRTPNFLIGDRFGTSSPSGVNAFAVSDEGTAYVTAGDEYQVLAIAPDGAPLWALRVAHERLPYTREDRDSVVEMLRSNFPDLDPSGTDWPERIGAIGTLRVDGHGHLYVFEFVPPFTQAAGELAVDVYGAGGERLFTGTMPNVRWTAARGDFVYALRTNEQTGEREAVRYRLEQPFR